MFFDNFILSFRQHEFFAIKEQVINIVLNTYFSLTKIR